MLTTFPAKKSHIGHKVCMKKEKRRLEYSKVAFRPPHGRRLLYHEANRNVTPPPHKWDIFPFLILLIKFATFSVFKTRSHKLECASSGLECANIHCLARPFKLVIDGLTDKCCFSFNILTIIFFLERRNRKYNRKYPSHQSKITASTSPPRLNWK